MTAIKNILFDLGGVIIDLDRDAAIAQFKKIGVADIECYLDPYRQRGFFHDFEGGLLSPEEFYARIREIAGKHVDEEEIDRGWLAFLLPVDPERLDFILDLRKRRYRTLLLSNTNPIVMKWANTPAFSKAGHPLSFYFDELYLSYELKCMKPDPEIFRRIIEMSGMEPAETLYIDDSGANVETGASFGFRTMLFGKNNSFGDILLELGLANDKPLTHGGV